MKALIFNSGLGSRLRELTASNPKCLVRLGNGESIFHRQLRVLSGCGITEFVITTGPYPEMIRAVAEEFEAVGCSFTFVENEVYDQTNYIFSMYRAEKFLRDDDFLLLHGDLVFDAGYAQMVIDSDLQSLGSVNVSLPQPEKDFKARVVDGEVREVSVKIFDDDCVAFQPFYKLSKASMNMWLDAVCAFVDAGDVKVYAENAANTVFADMGVKAFSYEGHVVEEIDTPEDLERVSAMIRELDFAQQPVFESAGDSSVKLVEGVAVGVLRGADSIASVFEALSVRKPLLITASFFDFLYLKESFQRVGLDYVSFTDYQPNPNYDDVLKAVNLFRVEGCDSVISVGGGSSIDVAKCVKLFAPMEGDGRATRFTDMPLRYSGIPHVSIPTTAGTGSESTHFAVCYVDGTKVSVAADCLHPDAVLIDPTLLAGLPNYQKKCTLLDALAQAIESCWSVRSSEESRAYSKRAIPAIVSNWEAYLGGDANAAREIAIAANLAGKAINLTTTTAAHAMSYKLTSLYGIPHGHAVAVCLPLVWEKLIDECAKEDREERVAAVEQTWTRLNQIGGLMCCQGVSETRDPQLGCQGFKEICRTMSLPDEWIPGDLSDIPVLTESVNAQRLGNFPLKMDQSSIRDVYEAVLSGKSFD